MTRLILLRHGETDWNVEGRWQGQIDTPLNARGLVHAAEAARTLNHIPIAAIYSSDLTRAYQTAQQVASIKGLPIHTDARLRELHQGAWQGMLVSEIKNRYKERFRQRTENPHLVAPPGGESVQQVADRVLPCITEIIKKYPQDSVLIVTHGFVCALIHVYVNNEPAENIWKNIPLPGVLVEYSIDEADLKRYVMGH
jgi:broad specificity phosphatase PhoE